MDYHNFSPWRWSQIDFLEVYFPPFPLKQSLKCCESSTCWNSQSKPYCFDLSIIVVKTDYQKDKTFQFSLKTIFMFLGHYERDFASFSLSLKSPEKVSHILKAKTGVCQLCQYSVQLSVSMPTQTEVRFMDFYVKKN